MSRFSDLYGEQLETSEVKPEVVGYNPNAKDGDNDGVVQEGTPFERPATTTKTVKKTTYK